MTIVPAPLDTAAHERGARRLKIVGDPHAEGFYLRMGATPCGHQPAPMDGQERTLPLFEKAQPLRLLSTVLAGLVMLAGLGGCDAAAKRRHQAELQRIEKWVREARGSTAAPKSDDEWARSETLAAISIAVGNYPLVQPDLAPTDRVRELADYLDETQASDLKTLHGALGILARIEAICPGGERNGAIDSLRDLQRRGEFPVRPEDRR